MSDDFLNDVAAAVDSGGTTPAVDTSDLVQDAPKTDTAIRDKTMTMPNQQGKSVDDVENELDNLFASKDPFYKAPKQEEEKKDEASGKALSKEAEQKDEFKREPRDKTSEKSKKDDKLSQRYLDRFLDTDDSGNLVNDDGEVIAAAGISRTYYEGLKKEARNFRQAAGRLAQANQELAGKFKELYDEYNGFAEKATDPVQSIVKETGFSDSEAKEAMNLLRVYKKDPITAIKSMLTQAKMGGIDISQIGANISVDPATMRSTLETLLDERMKQQEPPSQQDTVDPAVQEAQTFLEKNPHARQFLKPIAEAKQRFPDMSYHDIWLELLSALDKASNKQPQNNTKRRKKAKPAPQTRKVTVPRRDYGSMSFADIAKSVNEDFGNR